MQKIIEVDGLTKRYGDLEVVRSVSFYVEEGTLFAFLGPNGAGKSTTISILSTQITKNAGTCVVAGHELSRSDEAIRRDIGIVFQENVLDRRLTVAENVRSRAGLYGMNARQAAAAAERAMRSVDCQDFATRRYGALSGGQKRKADIARALVHTPRILFLDEPTTGLDPAARRQVWDAIRSLQTEQGITIFLTTHYMEEAAQADYIVVIDHGSIVAKDTPAGIREEYTQDLLRLTALDRARMVADLDAAGLVYSLQVDQFEIRLKRTRDAIPLLEAYRDNIETLEVTKGSMDQAFLNLIGKEDSKWAL